VIKEPSNVARYLAAVGTATEAPCRSPGRGPPYWKSRVLRRQGLGEEDEGGRRGRAADEVAWPRVMLLRGADHGPVWSAPLAR